MIKTNPLSNMMLLQILLACIIVDIENLVVVVGADLLNGQKTIEVPRSEQTAGNIIIVKEQSNDSITRKAIETDINDLKFEVSGLFLVNTVTGKDIVQLKYNMVIDIEEFGVDLTIRADISPAGNNSGTTRTSKTSYNQTKRNWYVLFDLDFGQLQRVEYKAPYYLAGKDDVTNHPNTANSLISALDQQHTITVTTSGYLETLIVDNDLDIITNPATEEDVQRDKSVNMEQQRRRQQRKRRTKAVGMTTSIGSDAASISNTKTKDKKNIGITVSNGLLQRRFLDTIWNGIVNRNRRSQEQSTDTKSNMNYTAITLDTNSTDDGSGRLPDGGMSITITVIDSKQNNSPIPVASIAPTPSIAVDTPKSDIQLVPTDDVGYQSHVLGYLNHPKSKANDYSLIYVGDKITLGFEGPFASETGTTQRRSEYYRPSSTFADYRLDVLFTTTIDMTDKQQPGQPVSYNIPGFYSGVGDSANTNMSSGSVWLCHFRPPVPGIYNWTASFVKGMNVAQNLGTGDSAKYMDGVSGTFVVASSTIAAGDTSTADIDMGGIATSNDLTLTSKTDRLLVHQQASGRNVYQFANSDKKFIKVGMGSHLINVLAKCSHQDGIISGNVSSIDAKAASHYDSYYIEGNPTFAGGQGKCSIGAVNYIANQTINTITISTLDVDDDVHPFVSDIFIDGGDVETATAMRYMFYDVSRLAQWDIILDWVESKGLAINMLLYSQNDDDDEDYLYDPYDAKNGALYDTRRLYYREMIARFSHHTKITWIIRGMNAKDVTERSKYIRSVDPYQNPILVGISVDDMATSLQRIPTINGVSVSFPTYMKDIRSFTNDDKISSSISNLISATVGLTSKAIIEYVTMVDTTVHKDTDSIRQQLIWTTVMGSGIGLSGGFSFNFVDIDGERDNTKLISVSLDQLRIATSEFWLNATSISYWDMRNSNTRVSAGSFCLSERGGNIFVVYKKLGESTINLVLDPKLDVDYSILWYDPRIGGKLLPGSVPEVALSNSSILDTAGTVSTIVSLGKPPSKTTEDWIAVVQCTTC
jgi:hypothetical protein